MDLARLVIGPYFAPQYGPAFGASVGTLDMAKEQIDAKLHVGVPVSSNIPLAALLVGAPAIAGAFFVADKLFGSKVANLVQVQYKVVGPLDDPVISFVKPY